MDNAVNDFYDQLKKNDNVLGIILFGSWARGNSRPDSDVDLLVIQKEGFKKTVEVFKNIPFEITYTTESGVKKYWRGNPDDCVELWNIGKVIFDRDGTIKKLRQYAKTLSQKGKAPLSNNEITLIKFDIYDQIKAAEKLTATDPTTAAMILQSKVFHLSKIYFDLHQYWTPPPKQRLQVLSQSKPDLVVLVKKFYSTETNLPMKCDLAKKIADLTFS